MQGSGLVLEIRQEVPALMGLTAQWGRETGDKDSNKIMAPCAVLLGRGETGCFRWVVRVVLSGGDTAPRAEG